MGRDLSRRRRVVAVLYAVTAVVIAWSALLAQASITLQPTTNPSAAQPGVQQVTVTGSNFPTGTISPGNVSISVAPAIAGAGPSGSSVAIAVQTLVGSTRRITFQVPSTIIVASPTAYRVTLTGATSTGVKFATGNFAALTLNPPPALTSILPGSGLTGEKISVVLTTTHTNFVQGSTQASFGPGISVGGASEGGFGPVTVTSATTATAQIAINAAAVVGPRTASVRTGVQQAVRTDGFIVARPNQAPTASAGGPYSARLGDPVTFNASASSDPDGDPLQYAWAFGDGTTGSGVSPTHTYATANTFTATVTVSDGRGGSQSASAQVTVRANQVPSASAGGPYSAGVGGVVSFNATGSSDADGDPLTYVWTFGDGGSATGPSPTHTYTAAGTFTATVMVSDDHGGSQSASAQVTITITGPPLFSLSIAEPAAGQTVSASPITVRGTVSDPLARVVVQNVTASVIGTTFEARNVTLSEGSNQILARAVTTAGAQASATLNVTLDSTPPSLTVFSPPDRSLFTATNATVSATVSDATTLTCSINGTSVAIQNGLLSGSVTLTSGGTTITVSCVDAAAHTSSRMVTVYQDPVPLVTSAVEPADGATGVPLSAPIEIRFSEPVDPATVTSGTVIVRAGNSILPVTVSVSADGLTATLTPVVPLPEGTEIVVTVTNGVRDAQGNPIAVPFITEFTTEGTAAPPGVVIGEVYDDRRSLPLDEATVDALDRATRQVLATTVTDDRGRYLLDPGQSNFVLRISKPGFTSVERAAVDPRGSVAEAIDARLTFKASSQTIQALLGGEATTTAGETVVIPPGAFAENTAVTLTPVSGQGPIGVFPPGWTPLSIVDFDAPQGAPLSTTFRLVDRSGMAGGRTATLARYDTESASWLALAQVAVPTGMPLEFSESLEPGQFALVVPDEGDGAPGAVLRGQPLPSSVAGTVPVDAQATGEVSPPVGRVDDPTPAAATIDITSPTPLRSGTLLRGDFMEVIMLRSGGQVSPLDTSQDFVSYRSLEDGSGRTLVAEFPIAPSRVSNPADVTDGSITVRLSRGLTTALSVIGSSGGGVSSADGSRVIAPSGAFADDVPVELRRLDSTTFPLASVPNVTFVGGLELNLSSVTAALPLMLSLSGSGSSIPTGSTVVVAEVRNVKGVERLVIVALAQVDGSDLTSVPRIGSIETVGIRQSGRYGFYRFDGALSAVNGTARDAAGRRAGHITELESLPFASITNNIGAFVLVSQAGAFNLLATAAANGDEARVSGTTGTPLAEIVIGPTPPRVEEITVRLPELEGDFAGPVALLGRPAPVVDDDSIGGSVGNGNGQIEAGEQIQLTLFVRNDGTIPIQGGSFALVVRGPPGAIPVQPAAIPLTFLPPDEPFEVGPFTFSVPAGTDPALLRYTLAYFNNGGLSNAIPFVLPLGVEHPNVHAASEITIRFSEPIVESSLNGGVALAREDGNNSPENVALVVAPDGRSVILRPFAALASDTVYRITLTSQVVDADGRSLANAPYVERLRTEDRTPPPLIPAGQFEASVPDEDGFVTITGSQGSVNPDDVVIGLNATTGFSVLATVNADRSFTMRVRAEATDELSVLIRDRNDNTTTVTVGALIRRDPVTGQVLATIVGRSGGTVSTQDGIRLIVPAGAVQRGTELAAVRLTTPFQLPSDLQTNAAVVAAFNARFTVVDRVRITSNVARFSGPIKLSVPVPEAAAVGDQFVVWRTRSVRFGGPLADIDRLTGIPLTDNPIVTADRLEIVESATVKTEGGQLVLSTDSPPFPGITEPGDFTIGRVNGPVTFLAGEVRRDSVTGPVVPGVVVRSLPDALVTSPFAAVTDSEGRFLVADGALTGPFEVGAVVSSRLDVFDHQFNRVIRRDVRGTVGPPAPPETVVAHLEEPFVLPTRLPPEITDVLGDLEPPTVELLISGPTFDDGFSAVGSPLTVTIEAQDNDEVAFVGLELDQGIGFTPVTLTPQRTFDITPTTSGLLTFRAQARDPSDNSTFEDAWVRVTSGSIGPLPPSIVSINPAIAGQGQIIPVTITGRRTSFAQGMSLPDFGQGITVGGVNVTSSIQLTVVLIIAPNAAVGTRTVTVATGNETVSQADGFTVVRPSIEIIPDSGARGNPVGVTVIGRYTSFTRGATLDFGPGIPSALTVLSETELTANLAIDANASLGQRTVTVTAAGVSMTDIFTVVDAPPPPRIWIVPSVGEQGQTLSVTIFGQSTNFLQGVSQVDLGAGIVVSGITVVSATELTATLVIAPNALLGVRTLIVRTGTEVVTFVNGFTVVPAPPTSQPSDRLPPPRFSCGTFDGSFVVQFMEPVAPNSVDSQSVQIIDPDGGAVTYHHTFERSNSRIRIVPDRYLRLGASYEILTAAITSTDGLAFDAENHPCHVSPPELVAVIGDTRHPSRADVRAINGETVSDVATMDDKVVAISYPSGSNVGDVGHLHAFQLTFATDGTFEQIETLTQSPERVLGRPQSLATDGAIAYVGNRYLGAIATQAPVLSPVVQGAEPLVFPDTMLGCFFAFTPICAGLSQYWDEFPQPASNLEVFDLGSVRDPIRLGAVPINSGHQLCRPEFRQVPGVRICDVWDPNTWPNRVEMTAQGIGLHNFLNNVEFFSPSAAPASSGVVGQVKRYGEVTPRGPDGNYYEPADNLDNEFLDVAFFDGFAVTQVRDGIRIMDTSPLETPENSTQLSFLLLPGTHGGRLGGVARFQWGGVDGVDTTSDLAFITTTDNTLRIYDVTTPTSPRPMGTLANTFGNMSFDLCRGIAYVHGRLGELHVVDFNDPDHPLELNRPDAAAHIFTVQTPFGRELLGRNVSFNGNTNRDGIVYLVNDAGVPAIRIGVAPAARFDKRRACRLKFLDANNHELDPATAALRVSKFVTNQRFDATDPDNFKAQVVDSAEVRDSVTAKLTSTKADGSPHSELDGITLTRVPGTTKFRSEFLRLVADSVDRDEEPTRTLIVETGGTVALTYAGASGVTAAMNVCRPSAIKTVTVDMVVVRDWLTTDSDAAAKDQQAKDLVRDDAARMNERYAQICMRVQGSVRVEDPPTGVNLADGLQLRVPEDPDPIAAETLKLLETLETDSTDDIQMFWVNLLTGVVTGLDGVVRRVPVNGSAIGTTNTSLISTILFPPRPRPPFTAAHELGHVLCGGVVTLCGGAHTVNPPSWETPHHPTEANLMYFDSPLNDTFERHRRLDTTEETTMRSHPLAR